jgi:hypothetical protein
MPLAIVSRIALNGVLATATGKIQSGLRTPVYIGAVSRPDGNAIFGHCRNTCDHVADRPGRIPQLPDCGR